MPEKITVVGDGAMGTVAAMLLVQGGHAVTLWGARAESVERLVQDRDNSRLLAGARVPDEVRLTADDRDAVREAALVVSGIPTQYLRGCWGRLAPHLPAGTPVVSMSKGIELETLRRPSEVIAEVLREHDRGGNEVAVLSGPNVAAELAKRRPASAVVACSDVAVARRFQQVLATSWFRLYTNDDVVGVELAGAVKNVIALAAGMVDGLRAGNNAKAALVTRGLVEITRLGRAMGARRETFQGLAGLGDLITTCVSPEGRNRHVGEQVGRGRRLDEVLAERKSVAEGVPTTRAVRQLAARHEVEMPITEQVYQILFEGKDCLTALTDLMGREPKPEV